MTRTPSLNRTVAFYETEQNRVLATLQAQRDAGLEAEAMRNAASAALSTCATNWERFRSDWHKRAIAKNATQYRQNLINRAREAIKQSQHMGKDLLETMDQNQVSLDISLPKHPTLATISQLIDPSESNISFRSKAESEKRAKQHLVGKYAAKVRTLDHNDWLYIEVMIGVRNALAHSSTRSVEGVNSAIQKAARSGTLSASKLGRAERNVRFSGIGKYLLTIPSGSSQSRVELICTHMQSLGAKFRD